MTNQHRVAPDWAWDTIDETLTMDANSNAFDPALRFQITQASEAMTTPDPGDIQALMTASLDEAEDNTRTALAICRTSLTLGISCNATIFASMTLEKLIEDHGHKVGTPEEIVAKAEELLSCS